MRLFFAALLGIAAHAAAQAPDSEALIAQQREALKPFAIMDGMWRGKAWTMTPKGRHDLVQTERVGPFLGGAVRVIEGRGYEADGSASFNAMAVITYDPFRKTYAMQSNAMGFSGSFPIRPTATGYIWETPAGPGATMRYTATIKGDDWLETGERVTADGKAIQTFEMKLKRIGKTDWPAAGAVPMK